VIEGFGNIEINSSGVTVLWQDPDGENTTFWERSPWWILELWEIMQLSLFGG